MRKYISYLKVCLSFTFLLVFAVSIFYSSDVVSAASCWTYTTNVTCSSDSACFWREDSWGSWCEELNCWSLWTQEDCTTTTIPNKNCTWQEGGTTYYCTEVSCWGFAGTDEATCVNNSANLNCQWSNSCHSSGYMPPGSSVDCWSITDQGNCTNTTGCEWGDCWEKGCWDYSDQNNCQNATDWRGKNCIWETGGSGSSGWCSENGCWKYSNQTACNNAPSDLNCYWDYGSCQELQCWRWDYTDESTCENNTANLSCNWDGSWCMMAGCWNYNNQDTCQNKSNCIWDSWESAGWCEEVNCWTWDSLDGGNKTQCENNGYALNCIWSGNPAGNQTSGWCYQDFSAVSCTNLTTERDCMDTYYCWWQYVDWNDPSQGGNCTEPSWGNESYDDTSILGEWNPGCYIFDTNQTDCENVAGCEYSDGVCNTNSSHDYFNEIVANGINCTMINSSNLCNNIPALSSCCAWQNGTCESNKLTTSCWDQMDVPPADSCEDANNAAEEGTRNSNCNQIAGYPWYMPCKWNNQTNMCEFDAVDVFGNATQSLIKIENKKNCEAAGGKWITENYCEGNISVPAGRCEYKFDEETNCNKACFACESYNSNGNPVNATNAREACIESTLGMCDFTADTTAPNGIGYCKAKEEFKRGGATDCNSDCSACTYKGDPSSNISTKRPDYYCSTSLANSDGGGCKWVSDNSTSQGGYCLDKGEKTCEESCDRCYTQDSCSNKGRTKITNGTTGSCKWQGSSDDGACVSNIGEDVEICWDGVDNNDDGMIDCADVGCYADPYCGFVEGDCFGWSNNNSCIGAGCEWVNDSWNPAGWCDFPGATCWKFDSNSTECNGQTNCEWSNMSGGGWCERDWTIAESCMMLNQSTCNANNVTNGGNCTWSVDSWCLGEGNSSEWCQNYGGWCDHIDFQPKDCWKYVNNTVCDATSGCDWHNDAYSNVQCEADFSNDCWQYSSVSDGCNATNDCWWNSDGGWCTSLQEQCWTYGSDAASCYAAEASGVPLCRLNNNSAGGWQFCEPACFNSSSSTDASACRSVPGCLWKEVPGWCQEEQNEACYNETNSNNATGCSATDGCRWREPGWCEPKGGVFSSAAVVSGGGVGGAMGGQCYKYDGNYTLCTNKSIINISCGWSVEADPWCDVDWSKDCWQYSSVSDGCNATNGCWWNSDGGWCMNTMDQCWSNMSLYTNASACNENSYCNSTDWGGCEPRCFDVNTLGGCSSIDGCRWINGWCNPAGMNEMFDEMESGGNVPLGSDVCDGSETSQASVDLCGFGMKDMGDAFGFGAGVRDFSNASVCNKQKLSSFVMAGGGQVGGMGIMGGVGAMTGGGSERVGDGNETVQFFVYLDTDGATSDGCTLSHNSSDGGYEFRFKYVSKWNASTSKPMETFNAYKCDNSKWKVTDIKVSAWKKKMCGEIGGPMIAVDKGDLEKFSRLYDSTQDMRVVVASAGENNNVTSPSDTATPGWTTPGAVDFEINDIFSYGADVAKFEDIMKNGFVEYEDCFNGVDDDADGRVDCWDYDCEYAKVCENEGVNLENYTDTTSPQVVGVKVEEYPDAVLVMYDTNKPTNGTFLFYLNDSQCLSLNRTIHDMGVLNSNVREFKSWHYADVYSETLGYSLSNNTEYYYKLKVCDEDNKCAMSRCTSLRTAKSATRCGYCNFVTRLKVPSGWNVSYDTDGDGTYDHQQGLVCGPNAGMKTNYTIARNVTIKIAKEDESVYFEFVGVRLSKSALNDKVRTLTTSDDSIINTSEIVGFNSVARDKLINNLHPRVCRVKIPFSGTCNSIYHCDDNGENCVDRTSDSTLLDSANCVWQIPYCEFSTYRESVSSSSSSSSSGGGGGGGGGGAGGATYSITSSQFSAGYTRSLSVNDQIKINISADSQHHYVKLVKLTSSAATINISSETQQKIFFKEDEYKFDVTGDDQYDLSVKLNNIISNDTSALYANITVKKASGNAGDDARFSSSETGTSAESEENTIKETGSEEKPKSLKGFVWTLIIILVVIGFAILVVLKYREFIEKDKTSRVKILEKSPFSKKASIIKTGKKRKK